MNCQCRHYCWLKTYWQPPALRTWPPSAWVWPRTSASSPESGRRVSGLLMATWILLSSIIFVIVMSHHPPPGLLPGAILGQAGRGSLAGLHRTLGCVLGKLIAGRWTFHFSYPLLPILNFTFSFINISSLLSFLVLPRLFVGFSLTSTHQHHHCGLPQHSTNTTGVP